MKRYVLVAASVALLIPSTLVGQLNVILEPTVSTAEKGKVFEINVKLEARGAMDDLLVIPLAPENFCVRAVPVADSATYRVLSDGSALVPSLGASSALTVQFRVQAPTQFRFSERQCDDGAQVDTVAAAARSLDNTRDSRVFVFNGRYRVQDDSSTSRIVSWTESVEVKYTTSRTIFLWAGMLGVFLGYVVKSLTSRREEVQDAFAKSSDAGGVTRMLTFLFGTHIDKLLTSLVLGFAALLTVQQAGIPIGGAAVAVLGGISIGILADDALISRMKK